MRWRDVTYVIESCGAGNNVSVVSFMAIDIVRIDTGMFATKDRPLPSRVSGAIM